MLKCKADLAQWIRLKRQGGDQKRKEDRMLEDRMLEERNLSQQSRRVINSTMKNTKQHVIYEIIICPKWIDSQKILGPKMYIKVFYGIS